MNAKSDMESISQELENLGFFPFRSRDGFWIQLKGQVNLYGAEIRKQESPEALKNLIIEKLEVLRREMHKNIDSKIKQVRKLL